MTQPWDVDPPALDRAEWGRMSAARRRDLAASSSRSEFVAERLAQMAGAGEAGQRLGTKLELRQLCEVSVGTFNEGVKLAQSRGFITSRSGPGGGIFAARPAPIIRLGNSVLAVDEVAASGADAVRMVDALNPLLVEDVLWHSSAADVDDMRTKLEAMAEACESGDAEGFRRANIALHARIAEVSPNVILRSVYTSLLEIMESRRPTESDGQGGEVVESMRARLDRQAQLLDAIAARDCERAKRLIACTAEEDEAVTARH